MSNPTFLLPIWNGTQFFDNNGNVLAGGQIFTYEGGSYTVQQTTYQGSNDADTPNPQPIVLTEDGRMPSQMWGSEGLYYNLTLTDQNGIVLDQQPFIIGSEASSVPSNAAALTVWTPSATPSYVSGSEFLVPGNVTSNYAVGNRVQWLNGSSTYGYGTVTAVSYTAPNTFVTVQADSTGVGSNLTAVWWSTLVAAGPTVDAGAVSYTTGLTYANADTVGGQIAQITSSLITDIAAVNVSIADRNHVYGTTGTFASGGTQFALTPNPVAVGLSSNQSYDVIFNVAGGTAPTLNISGLGAFPLVQISPIGTYIDAVIPAGMTTRVLWNGANYVMQAQLPAQLGSGSLAQNGYFTIPNGPTFQWGRFTFTSNVAAAVTFPVPFLANCYSVVTQQPSAVSYGYAGNVSGITNLGFTFNATPGVSGQLTYFAVGV